MVIWFVEVVGVFVVYFFVLEWVIEDVVVLWEFLKVGVDVEVGFGIWVVVVRVVVVNVCVFVVYVLRFWLWVVLSESVIGYSLILFVLEDCWFELEC